MIESIVDGPVIDPDLRAEVIVAEGHGGTHGSASWIELVREKAGMRSLSLMFWLFTLVVSSLASWYTDQLDGGQTVTSTHAYCMEGERSNCSKYSEK